MKAVAEVDQHLGSTMRTTQKWTALRDSTRVLLDGSLRRTPGESFALHTKVIEDTISLITHVGDTSKLTLDPDLDSYYLMNILIFQGPELSEAVAQARGLGGSVAASGKATPEQLVKLNELSVLMQYLRKRVDASFTKCFSSSTSKLTWTPRRAPSTARSKTPPIRLRVWSPAVESRPTAPRISPR